MQSPARMKFTTVQQYLSSLPDDVLRVVEELRSVIQAAAPDAEEVISYNMPAFKQKSILVYYAAFKDHIGFFPTSSPIQIFEKELSKFKTSKGTVQFPLDKKIPRTLVKKIVKFRIREVMSKKPGS